MEPISILLTQLRDMVRETIALLPQLMIAVLVMVLTYFAASLVRRLVRRIFRNSRLRASLVNLIVILSSMGVWVLGIMVAAIIAFPNLTPTKMLAGLGIGSVAIGFAFKDVFENFLAGIIILLRREMRINDYIECVGLEGKVENILVRETHVRQADGQLVIIPNSMLFKNPVTIRTDLDQRRTTIICGVAYGEDIEQSRSVIREAVLSCPSVASDSKPVQIFAQEFADSSINFEVTWWTGSKPLDIRQSRDEVIQSIKSALDQANIEIPFPYRTLTFNESLKIDTQSDS
ncbi:mechanosensitive ion channel family protein [Leucothrix pacifica]|uniref:Small-conductance mechanosensitive channel n=1 Tax=Leucothrix pacifica TaxID=1247513 RepID=A0A317CQS4_9GAMM|nr:mechanosensitive ion channel [Leucothrix pacifica]PWQ99883.1 mechanosensitive ion channel protein MscS [Leucothrix pacifica]